MHVFFQLSIQYFEKSVEPDKRTSLELRKRAKIRNQYNQLSTTPDPGYQWESDNFTIRHHKREPRGQPFPSR